MSGIEITVPGLHLVSEANAHEVHWHRAKRAKQQHGVVGLVLRAHRPVAAPCEVRITRLAPGTLDTDNLQGSAKHVRDAVALWLGVDDKDPRVTWHVGQERTKHYGARIAVRPWSPGAAVGSRVSITGDTTVAELSLDPATLRALARALDTLAAAPSGAAPIVARVHGLALTFHRTETP